MEQLLKFDNSDLQLFKVTTKREVANFYKTSDSNGNLVFKLFSPTNPDFVIYREVEGNMDSLTIRRLNSTNRDALLNYMDQGVTEYYIFVKTDEWSGINEYTKEQIEFMRLLLDTIFRRKDFFNLKYVTHRIYIYQLMMLAERMVRSIKIKEVIEKFYKDQGKERAVDYLSTIHNNCKANKKPDSLNLNKYIFQDVSNYDVLDLIDSLIKDKASINLCEDLNVGDKYLSISARNSDTEYPDEWCKICGKLGNKSRANVSITYENPTYIPLPVTNFDLETITVDGVENCYVAKTLRNVCIIKDGFLWKKTLPVKVSDRLRKELDDNKVTYYEGSSEDSIIIDLASIPVVCTKRFINYSNVSETMALFGKFSAEVKMELLLELYKPSYEPSEKDKFLSSLGIDSNGFYHEQPKRKTVSYEEEKLMLLRRFITVSQKEDRNININIKTLVQSKLNMIDGKDSPINKKLIQLITGDVYEEFLKDDIGTLNKVSEFKKEIESKIINDQVIHYLMSWLIPGAYETYSLDLEECNVFLNTIREIGRVPYKPYKW